MKAVVLQAKQKIAVEDVPEPKLQRSSDVLVRVTAAAICGSDIHIKHGLMPGIGPGTIMGHEFVGVVAEAGQEVSRFKAGDRVAAPAAVWCGTCSFCKKGQGQYCVSGGVWGGGEIFGKGLSGVQTSLVRVPYADICLTPIPAGVSDEQAVFVGDVLSTGFHAASEGRIRSGDTVVILGCGPIGLGALVSAWQFGPRQVLGVDMLPNRLALARQYGAVTINASEVSVVEEIRAATGGQGADVVIEAAGSETTFQSGLKAVRRGGCLSIVGIFSAPVEMPLHELVPYGVRISMGLGNLGHMQQLMDLIESGRVDLAPLVTHTFDLESGPDAFELFEHHKDKCMKVLLLP